MASFRNQPRCRLAGARLAGPCRRRGSILLSLFALSLAGCSSAPDLTAWRQAEATARPAVDRGDLDAEIAEVERKRLALELAPSRQLALSLAAENPENSQVLYLASRAESDAVFLYPKDDTDRRSFAALSALDYARRAVDVAGDGDAPSVTAMAQYCWAMGTSTHLQPMFDRSDHAAKTLEAIDATLARDPGNATALATKSILRLRLATLPWIASVMAWGAPDGSVDEAIELGQTCVATTPSVEHRLILAKALVEAERTEEARTVLRQAVAGPDTYPRDAQLRPDAEQLLTTLSED